MPADPGEHQRVAPSNAHRLTGLCQRLRLHLGFDGAPFQVVLFQFLGDALGYVSGIGGQQLDHFDAVVHPARGVDARTQAKAHLPRAHRARADAGHLLERDHAGPRR